MNASHMHVAQASLSDIEPANQELMRNASIQWVHMATPGQVEVYTRNARPHKYEQMLMMLVNSSKVTCEVINL